MKTFAIISLGCSRNLIDSEVIAGSLKKCGMKMRDIDRGVDVGIVNTCSFIASAREESVDNIIELAALKEKGRIKHLVICGCLSQYYKGKLAKEVPEADLVIGTNDFPKIPLFIEGLRNKRNRCVVSGDLTYLYNEHSSRFSLTPKHYAYVKISEGCSNFCSYCVISRLRGAFRSRTISSVLAEIRKLSRPGSLKEINLIGQDTTLFGLDQYGKAALQYLLKDICALKNSVRWVRILYTHPAHYTDELITAIRAERKVCRYLDLPIQHISDHVLKGMNRRTTKKDITSLIDRLRKKIPGVILRTSIIVGFPGETDKDFKELLEFVRRTRFERLGAFIYSKEPSTAASRFKGQLPEGVKDERLDELMALQQKISYDRNRSLVGSKIEVLVDETCENDKGKFMARTEGDAPEIDGTVYISGKNIKVGEFCKVKITDALEYDMIGEAV